MKNTKVLLRTGQRPHPVYNDLLDYPPKGITYIGAEKKHFSSKIGFKHTLKVKCFDLYQKVFLPAAPIQSDADLIHSTNNILLLTKNNWVIDCESASGFFGFNESKIKSHIYVNSARKILMKPNCKAILPWSNASEKTIKTIFGDTGPLEKSHVIYPAKAPAKSAKHKEHKLIFIGRRFEEKGGIYALEIMKEMNKKYGISSTVISNPSEQIIQKYSKYDITFKQPNLKKEEISNELNKSTILIFPTLIDTFGYTVLEAMSHGIPTITTNVYAMPEIIENDKTGFNIDAPISPYTEGNIFDSKKFGKWENFVKVIKETAIDQNFLSNLTTKTAELIESTNKYKKMSKNCLKIINNGKFSIRQRNKKLKKVYDSAITK